METERTPREEGIPPTLRIAAISTIDRLLAEAHANERRETFTARLACGGLPVHISGRSVRNRCTDERSELSAALAVASALNSCYEGIGDIAQLTWRDILFGHFQERLGLNVFSRGRGRQPLPTTVRVANRHVLRVVRSFPHMRAEVLVGRMRGARPADAWQALHQTTRAHRSVALFHDSRNSFRLLHGVVGDEEYKPDSCAIILEGQNTLDCMSFERACRIITEDAQPASLGRTSRGGYCVFRIWYDGPDQVGGEEEEEWAAYDCCGAASDSEQVPDKTKNAQTDDVDVAVPEPEEELPEFDCAVCLEILCEPVQLPCSHSFCRACLVQIPRRLCPLCRGPLPEDLDPLSAPVCQSLVELLQKHHPEEYTRRIGLASNAATRLFRIRVGNRYERVANPPRSRNGRHLNAHRWTAFVELVQDEGAGTAQIQDMVDKVLFRLAPFYTSWPASDTRSVRVGRNPEVRSPPFEVTRVGWGYFPVRILVTWQACVGLPPMEFEHELCFDNEGGSAVHAVFKSDAPLDAGGSDSTPAPIVAPENTTLPPTRALRLPDPPAGAPLQEPSAIEVPAQSRNSSESVFPPQEAGSSDTSASTRSQRPFMIRWPAYEGLQEDMGSAISTSSTRFSDADAQGCSGYTRQTSHRWPAFTTTHSNHRWPARAPSPSAFNAAAQPQRSERQDSSQRPASENLHGDEPILVHFPPRESVVEDTAVANGRDSNRQPLRNTLREAQNASTDERGCDPRARIRSAVQEVSRGDQVLTGPRAPSRSSASQQATRQSAISELRASHRWPAFDDSDTQSGAQRPSRPSLAQQAPASDRRVSNRWPAFESSLEDENCTRAPVVRASAARHSVISRRRSSSRLLGFLSRRSLDTE